MRSVFFVRATGCVLSVCARGRDSAELLQRMKAIEEPPPSPPPFYNVPINNHCVTSTRTGLNTAAQDIPVPGVGKEGSR